MPVSAPVPSSSSSTVAWNVVARAVAETRPRTPRRRSRPRSRARARSRRPRRSRSGSPGASTSWIASSTASGAARIAPGDEHDRQLARSAAELDGRRRGRLERRRAGVRDGREAGSDADAHGPADDTAHASRSRRENGAKGRRWSGAAEGARGAGAILARRVQQVIAVFGPTGVGKTAVAIALAERLRERGEDPVAVSADAMQVYDGPADPDRRGERSRNSEQLEHRLLGFVPITQTFSAGAYAERAHAGDRRAARAGPAPDRRRRHRPLPARGAGRARPAPAGRPTTIRTKLGQRPAAARRAPRRSCPPRSRPGIEPTDRQRILRAHELLEAGHEPPPPAHAPSAAVDQRTPATRRCWPR